MASALATIVVVLLISFYPAAATAANNEGANEPSAHLQTQLDAADAVHLLSRTGIGSSPRDVLQYAGLTRSAAIDKLLSEINTSAQTPIPAWVEEPAPHYSFRGSMPINQQRAFNRQRDAELAELRQWWTREMLLTPSPQTERLVLFWHNHFVSAYSAIGRQSTSMAKQNLLFRQYAMGNFGDFVKAVLRDPAMLDYLDNRSNRKKSPNENFARELLELFTMGEGNYSEADIKNAARALTGFTVAPRHDMRFQFDANNHDAGKKNLFGESGHFGADELVDLIMSRPSVAVFITKKFWHEYVSSTSTNDTAIDAVAAQFRRSGYSLEVLLRSLLQRQEFWSAQNRLAVIKSPVDLVVGTLRNRGLGADHAAAAVTAMAQQGQNLFEPPNVAGWSGGESWIAPNRLLSRMTWLKEFAANAYSDDVVAALITTASYGSSMQGNAMQGDSVNTTVESSAVNSPTRSPTRSANNMMSPDDNASDSMANPEMTGSHKNKHGKSASYRVVARLASDDFRGTPQVSIQLLNLGEVVWQSAVMQLNPGRDTQRHGVSVDYSDFLFEKYVFSVADNTVVDSVADNRRHTTADYDEVQVHFLNDFSDGDGDRNLYVERVNVNGKVHHAGDGKQQSGCIPENPFNAGYLYCDGYISIPAEAREGYLARRHSGSNRQLNFNGVRATQVFLDRAHPLDNKERVNPSVAFTLADATFGEQHWNNLQVQIVKMQSGEYMMVFQRYTCWPDCLHEWPACSNKANNDSYFRSARIHLNANPSDTARKRRGTCQLSDLHAADAELVKALWRSLPELAAAAKNDRKLTRKNILANFNGWQKHFEIASALAPAVVEEAKTSTPHLSELLPMESSIKAAANAVATSSIVSVASVEVDEFEPADLADWAESVDALFSQSALSENLHALFAPLSGQIESLDDAGLRALRALDKRGELQSRSQFKALLSSPIYQLK